MQKFNLLNLKKQKTVSRLLPFLLSAALFLGSALPVNAEAPDKGTGAFVLTQYMHINDSTVRKSIYNTSVQSKVVCVYNRGTLYNGYLRQYGIYSVYEFYTLSADGNDVVALNLTSDGFTETDLTTGESVFHDLGTSANTFYYQALKRNNAYYSFSIDGTCPLITYFSATQNLGGIASVNPTGKDIAFAYLKTGKILSGCNAYLSNWDSRSLAYGVLSQSSYAGIKVGSFSLLSPKLENGTFTHNGTIYDTSTLTRSGIVIDFFFNGGNHFEYWVNLPLSAGSYSLNLKDFESFTSGSKTYALNSVNFYPFVQEGIDGFIYRGNVTSFSYSDLLAAGCFENGGNPVVNLNADPGKGDNTDGTKDPSDIEDGTAGGSTGTGDGQHKGDMIEVPDTTDLITLLRNMAMNIARLPANINAAIINALQTLPLAIANAYWNFVRDPLGTIVELCKTVNQSLGGFPTSIVQLGLDFGSYISELGVAFSEYIATLGVELGENIAQLGLNLSLDIAQSGADIISNTTLVGADIIKGVTTTGVDIIANIVRFGTDLVNGTIDLINMGQQITEFLLNLPKFLTELWIPHDGYLQERIGFIKDSFPLINSTLSLADTIRGHISGISANHAPSIVVPLSSTFLGNAGVEDVTVTFDWFLPYRSNFLTLVSAFLWFGFLFEQYFSFKHLLNTTSGAVTVVRH